MSARKKAPAPAAFAFEESRLFSLADLARATGVDADALRKWFADGDQGGGLVLADGFDEPAASPGRPHRLHWRTAVALLLAVRLNAFGFKLRGGEAATIAGQVLKAGLAFEHLFVEARPIISVMLGDAQVFAGLLHRDAWVGHVEDAHGPAAPVAFAAIGTLLLDPAAFGAILTRLAQEPPPNA